ncbi:Spore germination protein YndE [compost metagenome]
MKISGLQMYWLMISNVVGLAMLYSLSQTVAQAQQDAWISVALAGIIGHGVAFLAVKLSLLHPDQSFIQYSQTILGKWLGKIIVIPYFMMWLSVNGMILRDSSEFVYIALFDKTPLIVIMIAFLILAVYVIYTGGLEGIARCSEIMGPLIVIMIIGTLVLSLNHLDWHQLTPVYADSGLWSIIKGSLPISVIYIDIILMTMVFCFLSDSRQALSRAMGGVAVSSLLLIFAIAFIIMTFGPNLSSRIWFPFFSVTRFISVLGFIQNVDIIILIIWMFSVFIKLSLYLFVTLFGAAQWLNIKDWRKLIWVIVPITFFTSLIPKNITEIVIDYPQKILLPYFMPLNVFCIPILLWIVGTLRNKISNSKVRKQ